MHLTSNLEELLHLLRSVQINICGKLKGTSYVFAE